jgi:hypothetical protein
MKSAGIVRERSRAADRRRSPEEHSVITAEYGAVGSSYWRRVAIDPDAATISFDNCHFPNRFFSWGTDPGYTCRISELRGVCWNMGGSGARWRKEPVLEVVTPAGRAVLPKAAAGFDAVYAALIESIPADVRLRWYEYPAAQACLAFLLIFPVGVAMTLLCAVLLERRLISTSLLAGVFIVLMPFAFLRLVSMWIGKPTSR